MDFGFVDDPGSRRTEFSFITAGDSQFTHPGEMIAIALKIPSGDVAWKAEETSRSTSAGIVVDGRFLYATQDGVKAVEPTTGRQLWHAGVTNNGYRKPVPVVWDNLVLINGTKPAAVDPATRKATWTVECGREADRFVRSRRPFCWVGFT